MANTFNGNAGSSLAPQQQVHEQLDSTNLSIDGLEDIAARLIKRLEPVSRQTEQDGPDDNIPAKALVPVAARISYLNSRIQSLDRQLQDALSALEI